jgi:glycerophosphoryl diester phosphodiesterase
VKCDDINSDELSSDADRELTSPSSAVRYAQAAGLLVHAFTSRNVPRRLASTDKANPINEYLVFRAIGIDGLFSDFTDTARSARDVSAEDLPRTGSVPDRKPRRAPYPAVAPRRVLTPIAARPDRRSGLLHRPHP